MHKLKGVEKKNVAKKRREKGSVRAANVDLSLLSHPQVTPLLLVSLTSHLHSTKLLILFVAKEKTKI